MPLDATCKARFIRLRVSLLRQEPLVLGCNSQRLNHHKGRLKIYEWRTTTYVTSERTDDLAVSRLSDQFSRLGNRLPCGAEHRFGTQIYEALRWTEPLECSYLHGYGYSRSRTDRLVPEVASVTEVDTTHNTDYTRRLLSFAVSSLTCCFLTVYITCRGYRHRRRLTIL